MGFKELNKIVNPLNSFNSNFREETKIILGILHTIILIIVSPITVLLIHSLNIKNQCLLWAHQNHTNIIAIEIIIILYSV